MEQSIYQQRKNKLIAYYRRFKQIPSYEELVRLFGLKSKGSLHKYIQRFIADGWLAKNTTGKLAPGTEFFNLPVLGQIQAGFPSAAEEELADTINLDEYLIANPSSSFLLRVSGDSMIDAGILPGDTVIVDRGREPRVGDIVVAEIDSEWTLKYFARQNGRVFLRAGNKKYPRLEPQEELKIAGVVTSVIRKYT